MTWLWRDGGNPRDIPQWAYRHLVIALKVDPDYLSQLKCVEQVNFDGDVLLNLIRIYDPKAVEKSTQLKDFTSLDQHPELILYEGHMEKRSGRIHIVSRVSAD